MQSPALSAACPACPVETTLTLISDKWKVLILRDLMPGTTAPRAPIPVQTAYAVPMGKVFTAWAKSQTLAAIAATVRTEYPTLVKPSDSFIAVTQTISRHPAANRQIHAITPSSFSHQ